MVRKAYFLAFNEVPVRSFTLAFIELTRVELEQAVSCLVCPEKYNMKNHYLSYLFFFFIKMFWRIMPAIFSSWRTYWIGKFNKYAVTFPRANLTKSIPGVVVRWPKVEVEFVLDYIVHCHRKSILLIGSWSFIKEVAIGEITKLLQKNLRWCISFHSHDYNIVTTAQSYTKCFFRCPCNYP